MVTERARRHTQPPMIQFSSKIWNFSWFPNNASRARGIHAALAAGGSRRRPGAGAGKRDPCFGQALPRDRKNACPAASGKPGLRATAFGKCWLLPAHSGRSGLMTSAFRLDASGSLSADRPAAGHSSAMPASLPHGANAARRLREPPPLFPAAEPVQGARQKRSVFAGHRPAPARSSHPPCQRPSFR